MSTDILRTNTPEDKIEFSPQYLFDISEIQNTQGSVFRNLYTLIAKQRRWNWSEANPELYDAIYGEARRLLEVWNLKFSQVTKSLNHVGLGWEKPKIGEYLLQKENESKIRLFQTHDSDDYEYARIEIENRLPLVIPCCASFQPQEMGSGVRYIFRSAGFSGNRSFMGEVILDINTDSKSLSVEGKNEFSPKYIRGSSPPKIAKEFECIGIIRGSEEETSLQTST